MTQRIVHGVAAYVAATLAMATVLLAQPAYAAAFDGAEGFGAQVTGGTGGVTIPVTRLDDPIPAQTGTLRHALDMNMPRIVIFRVGGVIRLREPLRAAPNVSIGGQTAPGSGIAIMGSLGLNRNSIMRYVRIRQGADARGDCLEILDTDVIVDHCSFSWSSDELIGFKRMSEDPERNVTIQWCILSEAEKGALAWYAHKTTFHHNLFAHNYIRNPVFAGGEYPHIGDIRNNVIYDIGNSAVGLNGNVSVNVVGNYFKVGNPARVHRYCVNIEGDPPNQQTKLYLNDIIGPRTAQGERGWNEVQYQDVWGVASEALHRVSQPFPAPPVTTQTASQAYELVLQQAGATLPVRDSVDERIVREEREGLNPGGYPRGNAVRKLAARCWQTLYYPEATR